MENKFEKIKNFWLDAGKVELDNDGLKPTARDPFMQLINEYHIENRLDSNDNVLDVGCGEGTSTIRLAKSCKKITGVDYSPTLIDQAVAKKSGIDFLVSDVLELDKLFPTSQFDAVVSIRCLINLPEKEMQYKALENMFKALKPGGLLFFSEGYQLGWDMLNVYRQRNNLSIINVVEYNRLFENVELETYLKSKGTIREYIGFGDYLFGSRVTHPMLTNGKVVHNSPINELFYNQHLSTGVYQKFDECSYAGIYVIQKNK
jgi:ubiquinone/menaquinone biosynthesis C-methylase UbiE